VRQTLDLLPGLAADRLTGSVRYYDSFTNDARLVIETLRSATREGAVVANYVRFEGATRGDKVWQVQVRDAKTGAECRLRPGAIVNATGPWSDRLPLAKTKLRLTKGVHLVIRRERLALPDAVVMTDDDRILFAIPWGERVILGTTDTDYAGPLKSPRCEAEDADYILQIANRTFPSSHLTERDVLSTWAGLRPLVARRDGRPVDISRRHVIRMSHPGWWDVTGGKLTTYRRMAEETVDDVARYLGRPAAACRTAEVPLLATAGPAEPSQILPPAVAPSVVAACCEAEWAEHVDDVMLRRTSWRHYREDHPHVAQQVASWMADVLGWNAARKAAELDRYARLTDP
jgi:glycerol-3-phosphate dehydrogenase